MEDDSALNVLLTGRGQTNFADLLLRMVRAKGLEFNLVCLKPKTGPSGESFSSTMSFKQALLRDLVQTYFGAEEMRIYEDRPKHTQGFREFLARMNAQFSKNGPRPPFTANVIQVTEKDLLMDPQTEVNTVQQMINTHNTAVLAGTASKRSVPLKIGRSVLMTSYMVSEEDSVRLQTLVRQTQDYITGQINPHATEICIAPYAADHATLSRVGGIGAKIRWKVNAVGVLDNRVWAARIAPVDKTAHVWTAKTPAHIVLAVRGAARATDSSRIGQWQPVEAHEQIQFETTVGEKVLLSIDQERHPGAQQNGAQPVGSTNGRKHSLDMDDENDFPALGSAPRAQKSARNGHGPKTQQRPQYGNNNNTFNNRGSGGGIGFAAQRGGGGGHNGGRGGRGNHRGGGQRGGQRGGRGGGGQPRPRGGQGYRSLDANPGQQYGGGSMEY